MEEELQKAMFNFQHNIDDKKGNKEEESSE